MRAQIALKGPDDEVKTRMDASHHAPRPITVDCPQAATVRAWSRCIATGSPSARARGGASTGVDAPLCSNFSTAARSGLTSSSLADAMLGVRLRGPTQRTGKVMRLDLVSDKCAGTHE